eukprot:766534-Hanusia_phi.AAC.2
MQMQGAPGKSAMQITPGNVSDHADTLLFADQCPPATLDKVRGSLWGLYIGDALAMPTHWYYDQNHLRRTYGEIKGYVAPQDKLPGSIMSLSNTGGGGRGGFSGSIVGDVILKGKKQFWERGGNWFYHRGMKAGENTLEGVITRLITKVISSKSEFDVDEVYSRYVDLMTTPDAHNDTYAGTGHRMFFANFMKGKKPRDCPDNDGHNTDALDGLVNLPPVVYHAMLQGPETAKRDAMQCATLFRRSEPLKKYAQVTSALLVSLVDGADLREALSQTGKSVGVDVKRMVERSGQDPMTACYLDSSFPSMLHFAYKYADSPEKALLANSNTGGENVARGAVLGAVLGAAHGMKGIPNHLIQGLQSHAEIREEIEKYIEVLARKSGIDPEICRDSKI